MLLSSSHLKFCDCSTSSFFYHLISALLSHCILLTEVHRMFTLFLPEGKSWAVSSVIQHALVDFPSALALGRIPWHHETVETSSELCDINPSGVEGASHQQWSLSAADKPFSSHFRCDVNKLLIYRI